MNNHCHHVDKVCCPICKSKLEQISSAQLRCTLKECRRYFPIIDGIPILINEQNSLFRLDDFLLRKKTTLDVERPKLTKRLRKLIPTISRNFKVEGNLQKFATLLGEQRPKSTILIIGGSILGEGSAPIYTNEKFQLVETDVSFGPRTQVICDAHDIPFGPDKFDAVIVQAVLEHVVDPFRCVAEIHRVLKQGGLVYADTPFMQQVHMGKYDFMRFTHLGHRRLFRNFTEIESGASCGTGMALAWAYRAFLWSFSESKYMRTILGLFASATSFWLKYLDYFLIDKPAVLDAASGYYFIGSKSSQVLTDADLLLSYKGAQR